MLRFSQKDKEILAEKWKEENFKNLSDDSQNIQKFFTLCDNLDKGILPIEDGSLSQKEHKDLVEVLLKIKDGESLKEAINLTKPELEYLYAVAYEKFSSGKTDDALELFKCLFNLDPEDYRFSQGIAGCLMQKKQYAAAIYPLFAWLSLKETSPFPVFYAAIAYLNLNKLKEAHFAIHMALNNAKKEGGFHLLLPKITMMQAKIENILKLTEIKK